MKSSLKNNRLLYGVWKNMLYRCYNSNHISYKYYGLRGIKVCKRWHDYALFVKDMLPEYKKGLTIDRYPNQLGDYKPSNCRWATPKQQARNKTNNVIIKHKGYSATISEWSEITGIKADTITRRRKKGLDNEKALNQKLHIRGESRYNATLTNKQALDIYNSPLTPKELAKIYKVKKTAVEAIKGGCTWQWLTSGKPKSSKLSPKAIKKIRSSNLTVTELAIKYKRSKPVISLIRSGKIYTSIK